ncbi:MAG: argininosuccinate lyase [Verrucomicrobia bacterium Tous-C9LFEB]|nr:MAG: argininosuccinate lyase [Verrucomicrobia bacterium Tous-C9LFEB]
MSTPKKALWGGRFATAAAERLQRYGESVSFDWRLYKFDIAGSIAHATMLRKIGVLKTAELKAIIAGLQEIEMEILAGKFNWRQDREDVHMNIEATLTERVPAGAKLHTGRSRNDQVATDVRLWLKDQILSNQKAIRALQKALVKWGQRDFTTVIPGFTHLQRAQPVLLAHHLLAYVEMLQRDHDRLADAFKRTDVLPLGSGAIAGSTLPLDREFVAMLLGFSSVTQNSMDGVSDRDFIVEYCAACALLAVHLSRLSEDLILWSSAEFGFVRIGDAYTTGSSLMPQKKNPDIAELARGKTGRVVGNLMAMLTLLKGLPMTYNRDLQEDKERLFDTADTVQNTLEILAEMLGDVAVNNDACGKAAADPLLLATDLADWLVKKGMPFRQAHHAVGSAVALAEKTNTPIDKLPIAELKKISPIFTPDALSVFSISKGLASRQMTGSPNPKLVKKQLERWTKSLKG